MTTKKTNKEESVVDIAQPQVPTVTMSVETMTMHHQVLINLLAENQTLKSQNEFLLNHAKQLEEMLKDAT